jgi:hypothetical protein
MAWLMKAYGLWINADFLKFVTLLFYEDFVRLLQVILSLWHTF